MAGSGAVPLMTGFGAMPRGDDGVVIGVAKAPSTSRGGCCVRQDDVVMDAVTASTTTRWCMVVSGAATALTTTRWCTVVSGAATASSTTRRSSPV